MSEIVALLLDDAMPPERLGALFAAARKRRGMKRKEAAAAAGTTAAKLRRYEQGDEAVPAAVCAQLAECYGDDLTAHVPLRVPPSVDGATLAVGEIEQTVSTDADDIIAGYIDIVRRLRNTGPGDPLALRTVDIVALAGALGRDRDAMEQKIAEVLGCSRTEARRLHGELLRRKVILPVAGLAAGMAAFAGVAYATQTPSIATAPAAQVQTQAIVASEPATPTTATPPTTAAVTPTTVTPPTTTAPAPPVVHHTTPTTEVTVDATVPPNERAADVPDNLAPPMPDPADPPVSVLPGETPITIIGTPDSAPN